MMNAQEKQHLKSDDGQCTLYVNTLDAGTADFDISEENQGLIEQELKNAETYSQWFEGTYAYTVNLLEPE